MSVYSQNFDALSNGAAVTGWADVVGTWVVRNSAFVSSPNSFGKLTASAGDIAVYTSFGAGVSNMVVSVDQIVHLDGSANGRNVSLILRCDDTAANGYFVIPDFAPDGKVTIFNRVASTFTAIDAFPHGVTFVDGDTAHMKAQVVGPIIQWKIWKGSTEPTEWSTTWTDSAVTGTGKFGLYTGNNGAGSASTASCDNIVVDTATAIYTPSSTLNWWAAGGATGCVAAYQPRGALNYTASKTNLANPGTHDLTDGTAPTWTAKDGWIFNGSTQNLVSDIVPTQTYTMLVQFSDVPSGAGALAGIDDSTDLRFYLWPRYLGDTQKVYAEGNLQVVTGAVAAGNLALSGQQGYYNGVADGSAIAAFAGAPTKHLLIGSATAAGSNAAGNFGQSHIQAVAIYSGTLTPTQIAAVALAMSQVGPTFATINATDSGGQANVDLVPLSYYAGSLPYPVIMYHHGVGETETALYADALKATCVQALLTAGYILCGSNAHGDNWGNAASLTDYLNLWTRVSAAYNTSSLCFWSQSMGGLSGLLSLRNATFTVKGWLGTYPVTNLSNMYGAGAGTYFASIETAYGFSGNANYAAATTGHDPNLLSASGFLVPKDRMYSSAADTVVAKASNATLMKAIFALDSHVNSNVLIDTSGDHGDASNFVPTEYVAFFNLANLPVGGASPYAGSQLGVYAGFGSYAGSERTRT